MKQMLWSAFPSVLLAKRAGTWGLPTSAPQCWFGLQLPLQIQSVFLVFSRSPVTFTGLV